MNYLINKVLKIVFTALALIIMHSEIASAIDKEEVEMIIKKAESIGEAIDKNRALFKYIPFDTYGDALLHIIYARNQLNAKKYNSAYFYGAISIIKFETATITAQSRKYEYDTLLLERDFYKEQKGLKTSNSALRSILDANLEKRGNVYRVVLLDKYLFNRGKTSIHTSGKVRLNKIVSILSLFPKSNIKIISHSVYYDRRKATEKKAETVLRYLKNKGINSVRMNAVGLGNKELIETYLGYKRLNRIEIILSNINK